MERVHRSGTALQRTYYVRGEPWCQHAERVAAAASIDRLMGAEGLTLSPDCC